MSGRAQKRLLKRVSWVVLALVVVAGSVGYGYLCGVRHLPGYGALRRVHIWASEQPLIAAVYTVVTGRHRGDADPLVGAWNPVRAPADTADADAERRLKALQTIPYLSGYETAPTEDHVTVYDRGSAYDGLNLYTSGHAAVAILMNMRGDVVHRWKLDFVDAFPDRPVPDGPEGWAWWARVHLDAQGGLIAIYDGYGLVKVDRDSNPFWAVPGTFHHDLFVDDTGMIYCLTRETKVLPRVHRVEPVMEDFIVILNPDGGIVRKVSLLEAHERSPYAPLLENMPAYGDVFHTNTIEVCDGSCAWESPFFRRGNVLVSFAMMDELAVVDLEREAVVWALTGQWNRQHCPTLLENGHVLVLDNLWHRRQSRVIEVDPLTQAVTWSYQGAPESPFYTATFGTNQRLPNGNTLINESDAGRAFEVTPGGEIVWEFLNPARAGENHELIATLFDFQRLDSTDTAGWLSSR